MFKFLIIFSIIFVIFPIGSTFYFDHLLKNFNFFSYEKDKILGYSFINDRIHGNIINDESIYKTNLEIKYGASVESIKKKKFLNIIEVDAIIKNINPIDEFKKFLISNNEISLEFLLNFEIYDENVQLKIFNIGDDLEIGQFNNKIYFFLNKMNYKKKNIINLLETEKIKNLKEKSLKHLIFTFNGSNMRIYLNGHLEKELNSNIDEYILFNNKTSELFLAKNWIGDIYKITILDHALGPLDVFLLYIKTIGISQYIFNIISIPILLNLYVIIICLISLYISTIYIVKFFKNYIL